MRESRRGPPLLLSVGMLLQDGLARSGAGVAPAWSCLGRWREMGRRRLQRRLHLRPSGEMLLRRRRRRLLRRLRLRRRRRREPMRRRRRHRGCGAARSARNRPALPSRREIGRRVRNGRRRLPQRLGGERHLRERLLPALRADRPRGRQDRAVAHEHRAHSACPRVDRAGVVLAVARVWHATWHGGGECGLQRGEGQFTG